ncbi:MAG TPA: radical SAM protein [Planctomycetes bacterium]|nr:radical SAM protein [Planctomycetota bacterium]
MTATPTRIGSESAEDITNFLSWKDGARPERTEDATETNWVRNKVGEFPNFAELPEPDYELFDTQRITDQKHGWFGLMTSRGCPYRCTYCLNHKVMDLYKADLGRGVSNLGFLRYRPADRMIAEIRKVLARYENIGTFILDDDLFTMNPEHAIAFCEAYAASEIDVPFVVNSHVKQLDPRVAEALAKAGCRILKLGIESGSPRVRTQILERHMSQDDILGTVASSEKFNLHTSGFLMVGLPTETREERMVLVTELEELVAALSAFGTTASEQVAATTAAIAGNDVATMRSLAPELRKALEAVQAQRAANARRSAVLTALARLGYEARDGMETAWAEDGSIVLRKPATGDLGVKLSGGRAEGPLQLRPVRFGAARSAEADRDAEVMWCGDFRTLKDTLSEMEAELTIVQATPVGAVRLEVVGDQSTDRDRAFSRRPKIDRTLD